MPQFLINGNIDWSDLRTQKKVLIDIINETKNDNPIRRDSLLGLLHLIDDVQDNAVESGIWEEEEIFG